MRLTLHPDAESDIHTAASFYEREGTPALAARFVAEFRRVGQLLIEYPEIGSLRPNGRRGISMNVFPYSLIYRVLGDEVRVLVVKHNRQHPGFGGGRS